MPTTTKHKAQALAQAGWHVLPIGADKAPKLPHGAKGASNDPKVVRGWWAGTYKGAGVGVRVPVGVLVVDVDVKDGKVGAATLAALELQWGTLPLTKRHETPSGGWHLWFTVPKEKVWPGQAGQDVDLLWHENRYAAMMTADGVEYENDLELDMVPLPDAWVAGLTTPRKAAAAGDDRLMDMPSKGVVEACLRVLPAKGYQGWMETIAALTYHYRGTIHEEWARALSHTWSAGGEGYNEDEVDRMWDTGFLSDGGGRPKTFATVRARASKVELTRLTPLVRDAKGVNDLEDACKGNLVLTKGDRDTLQGVAPAGFGKVEVRQAMASGDKGNAEVVAAQLFAGWYSCPKETAFMRLKDGHGEVLSRAGFDQMFNAMFKEGTSASSEAERALRGRQVDGMRYAPRKGETFVRDGKVWFNEWTHQGPGQDMGADGVAAMAKYEDALYHYTGDLEAGEQFLDILALTVQGKRPTMAIGLKGHSGAGRTTLVHQLLQVVFGAAHVGGSGTVSSRAKDYDNWLASWRETTFIEELTVTPEVGEAVKAMNTGRPYRVSLNIKSKGQVEDYIDTLLVFLTNNMPTIIPGLPRRLFLLPCQWATKADALAANQYTPEETARWEAMLTEYGPHLRWTLMNREVDQGKYKFAPITSVLIDAEEASRSGVLYGMVLPDWVTVPGLQQRVLVERKEKASHIAIVDALQDLGYRPARRRLVGGGRECGYERSTNINPAH